MRTTSVTANLPSLKIGSRVRCTDDGVTGRIAWANAVSVKIKWDDGEEITWKRDSLANRPVEILDTDEEVRDEPAAAAEPVAEQVEDPTTAPEPEQGIPTERITPAAEAGREPANVIEPQVTDVATTAIAEQPAEVPATEPVSWSPEQAESTTPTLAADASETAPAKPKRQRKAKAPAEPKEKKVSAIDAAVKVLGEAGQALTTQEMIEAMASKGYWSSPGGKTPAATLYSSILRELDVKGEQARFVKAAPGRFALRAAPDTSAT